MARHGGGAFSGKDPTKVDRSAAYAVRWVAKNVVAAGLAERCEVQVAYAIGVAHPVSVFVETFGTEQVDPEKLGKLLPEFFDLRPAAIVATSTCAGRSTRRPPPTATSAARARVHLGVDRPGHGAGQGGPLPVTTREPGEGTRAGPGREARRRPGAGRRPAVPPGPPLHLPGPEALRDQVHLGTRVKVPFGGRRRVDGWVVGRGRELPPDARDVLRRRLADPLVRPRRARPVPLGRRPLRAAP
jgi:hypothetical protein